jgi:DNA polymerase III delta subunit
MDFLISILNKIPESNIVVFSSNKLTEKSVLTKKMKDFLELKIFNIKNTYETKLFLQKKYDLKIDSFAIDKIISYKSNNLSKIILELEKLFLCKDFIKEIDIIENIVPELEETIFAFVDKILNKDKK